MSELVPESAGASSHREKGKEVMNSAMNAETALECIVKELREHNRTQRNVVEQLERIADSLQLPPPRPPEILRNPKLHRALVLVREILDTPKRSLELSVGPSSLPQAADCLRDVLFQIEALLSTELGQPIWEGRRS